MEIPNLLKSFYEEYRQRCREVNDLEIKYKDSMIDHIIDWLTLCKEISFDEPEDYKSIAFEEEDKDPSVGIVKRLYLDEAIPMMELLDGRHIALCYVYSEDITYLIWAIFKRYENTK